MGRRMHEYVKSQLSKLRKNNDSSSSRSIINNNSSRTKPIIANKNWMLSTCSNHPKTTTSAVSGRTPKIQKEASFEATLSDVDKFLLENFNSLYAEAGSVDEDGNDAIYDDDVEDDVWSNGSLEYDDKVLPASLLQLSHRFFGASPGDSNSLMAEAHLNIVANDDAGDAGDGWVDVPEESTAVIAFSKDPYKDFRQSMDETVKARGFHDASQPLDWAFMEDLLMCFLELNDRSVHEYILAAFCDLTVSIRQKYSNGRLIKVLKNK